MTKIKNALLTFMIGYFLLTSQSIAFASAEVTKPQVEPLSSQEKEIVLDDLSINEDDLSKEEKLGILTKGTAIVWNKTYKNEYGIKKNLSMSASLLATGERPYTTIKITNTGSNPIAVSAYKGSIGGSNSIHSMTVLAGKSKTMTVSRKDVIKFGVVNGQGTRATLGYTISVYNASSKRISFKVYSKRFD